MNDASGAPRIEDLLAHATWVRGLAQSLVSDPNQAADLEQEAWLAALRSGPRSFEASRVWMRTVVRNLARQKHRSEGRRREREQVAGREEALPSPGEVTERLELQEKLAALVRALEEPYRSTIVLRYFEQKRVKEIAALEGVSPRTVETRLRRALEKLRERLDRTHGGDREAWLGAMIGLASFPTGTTGKATAVLSGLGLLLLALGVWALGFRPGPTRSSGGALKRAGVELAQGTPGASDAVLRAVEDESVLARSSAAIPEEPAGSLLKLTLLRAGDLAPLVAVRCGLRLRFERESGLSPAQLTTDGEGRLVLPWSDAWGTPELRVPQADSTVAFGFKPEGPGEFEVIVPRRGGTLRGVVVDLEGTAIPRAELLVWRGRFDRARIDAPDRSVRADAEGRFELEDLAGRTSGVAAIYTVIARTDDGRRSVHRLTGALRDGEVHADRRLVIHGGCELAGTVVDERGEPVAEALVTATCEGALLDVLADAHELVLEGARPPGRVAVQTDLEGRFSLPVTPEPWQVQVDHPDHPRWLRLVSPVSSEGAADVRLHVVLEAGTELSGVVRDEQGTPVPEVRITLISKERRPDSFTDAAGRYRLEGLSPVEGALICFSRPGFALEPFRLDVHPGSNVHDVVLGPEAGLHGIVRDADGRPVEGALVEFRGQDRIEGSELVDEDRGLTWEERVMRASCVTDAEGRFRARGLYAGDYRLRVRESRASEIAAWLEVHTSERDIEIVLGEGLEDAVTLIVTVLDGATGAPVRDFTLAATPARSATAGPMSQKYGGSLRTEDGVHRLRGLDPGYWRIHVASADGTQAASLAEAAWLGPGEHAFSLSLEPTGTSDER